jgi:hypothetical protein
MPWQVLDDVDHVPRLDLGLRLLWLNGDAHTLARREPRHGHMDLAVGRDCRLGVDWRCQLIALLSS